MRDSYRPSTDLFDSGGGGGGGYTFVEQTTDMITRFRDSLIRSRKERLLDEDVQATDHLLDQIHLTEFFAKETLTKLVHQGNSMQRSFTLINQLQKEIKDIAEDLNDVNGGKCCGLYSNGTLFGFSCFGCFKRRKKKKKKKKNELHLKQMNKLNSSSPDSTSDIRWVNLSKRIN